MPTVSELRNQLMRVDYIPNEQSDDSYQTYLVQQTKELEWWYYFEISVSVPDQEMEVNMFLRDNREVFLDENLALYFYIDGSDQVAATFCFNPFETEVAIDFNQVELIFPRFNIYQEALAALRLIYNNRLAIANLGYLSEKQYNAFPGCWLYNANPLEFSQSDIGDAFDDEGGGGGGMD